MAPRVQSMVIYVATFLLVFMTLVWPERGAAQQCKPLLISGKKTLYQRVVTHPGAALFARAGDSSLVLQRRIKPFTIFYVYERTSVDGTPWLQVGPSVNCKTSGWVKGTRVSDWLQSMTLVFTERTGRQPVLFFKKLDSLERVGASDSPGKVAAGLLSDFRAIQSGGKPWSDAFPVLAIEPLEEAVSRDRFYLMPIFRKVQRFEDVNFLKIASIDPASGRLPDETGLKTAIVFIIDTTISMTPYIKRTREAVQTIYDSIEKAGLMDKVAFGMVAFRNSTKATPALGYVSRVLSDLRDGHGRAEFERALTGVTEAEISTHSFNEDAFAGLKTALEELNWGPYQSRLAFLISDAGAIRNDDPYSSTGMNEGEMADMAEARGVKIFALHLKTPEGKKLNNHAYAEPQYRALTRHSDATIRDLYTPIDAVQIAKGVRSFGRVVESVAAQMVKLVRVTAAGERFALPDQSEPVPPDDVAAIAERKAAILGYAMQLEFLGRKGDAGPPKVVNAWVSDMDLARPDTPAFQTTVLLTKNQLSDLHQRLKVILDQAQRTKRTGARDFFQSILSAVVQTSRDPDQFRRRPDQNLCQLGYLGEFLDDLPCRSYIMSLTEEDWYRLSVGEQQAFVDDLESKIRRYQQYYDDVANWVGFGKTDPGDKFYRVPLSMMP